jgi:hypothetical protein
MPAELTNKQQAYVVALARIIAERADDMNAANPEVGVSFRMILMALEMVAQGTINAAHALHEEPAAQSAKQETPSKALH